jgi:hypothetical protein
MSHPTGQPEVVPTWNPLRGKNRMKYESHARSCKSRVKALHTLNLGVYGFSPNEMGRQAATEEWVVYARDLPSEDGVVLETRCAKWPDHWLAEDHAVVWTAPSLVNDLGGVPAPVLVASTNNNKTKEIRSNRKLKRKNSAFEKNVGPDVAAKDIRLVYSAGHEPLLFLAEIVEVAGKPRSGLGGAVTDRVAEETVEPRRQVLSQLVTGALPTTENGSTPFTTLAGTTFHITGSAGQPQSVLDATSKHIADIIEVITCTNGCVYIVDRLFPVDTTTVPICDTGVLLGNVLAKDLQEHSALGVIEAKADLFFNIHWHGIA